MPRKPRLLIDEGYYHLIARGNNRLFLFSVPEGFETFKSLLAESKGKFGWKLNHYCLMSNHFHLLGQLKHGRDLPRLMQFLLHEYSRWYRKQSSYIGHLWQGRYKSPWIEKEDYLLDCARYIERNPLRARLTEKPEDYEWNSYRHYAFGETDPLIDNNPCYEGLNQNPEARQRIYREFVSSERPYEKLVDETLIETHF